ncbi:MAG: 30S ribosomal protein S7 [Candidatus Tagabacteria bacterium CG09_land_8_20_14_0_10_41_14]|uniref:Small ribosomal subunit protein uS7 n=2 Tax=Candidatus Tagaibacteriota TaxID=1817918 RepID=A0A2H0WLV5_9BACT|nr:MAG: 30S ribosomal protein S7 [Candidatus Tagabacteria bacterium CG09_land_8_20_14_0_10_41_14]PJE73146.1 MAG: 30S ribosomal protein S7 [Candidatus Tagabacteria bacterium CG10_big_fil_rev_8_21_14_0_10_40_13]
MRRKVKNKVIIKPDYKYGSLDLEKFTNHIMEDGKKSIARKVVYSALDEIKKSAKKDPMEVFETALQNATPLLEVRSRRVGGANYQIPREVSAKRGITLAMRWIIQAARAKKGRPIYKKIAEELISASKKEGDAMKKRENTHRMAEANKAFAHFAWGK